MKIRKVTNIEQFVTKILPKQPQNNKSIVGIFQDSLLGCARFTRENINFDARHAMNLLMYYDNVNPALFKNSKKKYPVLKF